MPTLDDVYWKFGYAAEAAQLLETELGNVLAKHGVVEKNLVSQPDPNRAAELFRQINKHTLRQLITKLKAKNQPIANLEDVWQKLLTSAIGFSIPFIVSTTFVETRMKEGCGC
jgi:hypothetical protein